jgi:hypothetical protein
MRFLKSVGLAVVLAGIFVPQASAFPEAATDASAVIKAFCDSGHYRNSAGRCVRRPTRTPDNRPPAGAYSFSQSRRGTCSHHGGVGRWL